MDIFNHPNKTAYEEQMSPYRFLPHGFCRDIRISSTSGRVFYILAPETAQLPITLQTFKDTSNPFNFFYYEVEIANYGKSFVLGFGNANFAAHKAPGKSKFGSFSIGFSIQEERCALFYRKNKIFESSERKGKVFGIGLFALKPSAFITIDGRLVAEVKLPRLAECFPTVTLLPGSDVTFNFTSPLFDVRKYVVESIGNLNQLRQHSIVGMVRTESPLSPKAGEKSKGVPKSERKSLGVRQERTLTVIGDYLDSLGFSKTMKVLEKNQKIAKIKSKNSKEMRNSKSSIIRKGLQGSTIREEVMSKGNWNFLLEKGALSSALTPRLRANITLRAFLQAYYSSSDEGQRLSLFKDYGESFSHFKGEEIIGTRSRLEEVIGEIICGDNNFEHLLSADNKNLLLTELLGDSEKPAPLEGILKYLAVLLRTNSRVNGLEPGFSFDNLKTE
jgi:hypothetical protein